VPGDQGSNGQSSFRRGFQSCVAVSGTCDKNKNNGRRRARSHRSAVSARSRLLERPARLTARQLRTRRAARPYDFSPCDCTRCGRLGYARQTRRIPARAHGQSQCRIGQSRRLHPAHHPARVSSAGRIAASDGGRLSFHVARHALGSAVLQKGMRAGCQHVPGRSNHPVPAIDAHWSSGSSFWAAGTGFEAGCHVVGFCAGHAIHLLVWTPLSSCTADILVRLQTCTLRRLVQHPITQRRAD